MGSRDVAGLGKTVLVVLGDPQLRQLLCAQLARCSVLSVAAATIPEAARLLQEFRPDAMLIDGDLGPLSGLVGQCLAPIPSAMLTRDVLGACGESKELCGADYCIAKPIHPTVVVQTIIGIFEGRRVPGDEPDPGRTIRRGLLVLNETSRTVLATVNGREDFLDLSPREFTLLSYLMAMPDTIHTRSNLAGKVWQHERVDGRTVDVSIMRLRKRLKAVHLDGAIVTVPGKGYRLSTMAAWGVDRAAS